MEYKEKCKVMYSTPTGQQTHLVFMQQGQHAAGAATAITTTSTCE